MPHSSATEKLRNALVAATRPSWRGRPTRRTRACPRGTRRIALLHCDNMQSNRRTLQGEALPTSKQRQGRAT